MSLQVCLQFQRILVP